MPTPRLLHRLPPTPTESGMAVLGALLVVMVATVLVTGLLQRQAADVRAIESVLASRQAGLFLQGGLDWARLVLAGDARRHATTRPEGQLWAIPVEDTRLSQLGSDRVAVFSGHIEDATAKFNLGNLARNGAIHIASVQALGRLLRLTGQPDGLAPILAQRVALGQRMPAQDEQPGRPPAAPALVTLEDLLVLQSVKPDAIEALRPFVTILPEITSVNANTAPAEVLAAVVPGLDVGQARALVAQRDRGAWFNNAADFVNRLANPNIQVSDSIIDVNSAWFLVKGAVTLDNAVVAVQALLHRPSNGFPEVTWTRELL